MAISRVSQNKVIILDEPTSGLDKRSMHRVVDQLESMKRNHTIIIISHDYEFIRNVADRIFYLEDGRIRENFYLDEDNVSQLNKTFEEKMCIRDRVYSQMKQVLVLVQSLTLRLKWITLCSRDYGESSRYLQIRL